METLIQTADQLVINFRAKQISQGKVKEPQMRSLNHPAQVKNKLLNLVFKRSGFTPSDLFEGDELFNFLNKPLTDSQRLAWYKLSAKYRNNFKVK